MKLEIAFYKRKKFHYFKETTRYDSDDTNIQLTDILQNNSAQRKWYTETSKII